jgi:hypothetical protein
MVPTIRATGLSSLRFCFPFHSVTSFRSAVGLGEGEGAKGFGANSDAHQLARTTECRPRGYASQPGGLTQTLPFALGGGATATSLPGIRDMVMLRVD